MGNTPSQCGRSRGWIVTRRCRIPPPNLTFVKHYGDYRHYDLQDGWAVYLRARMSPSGLCIAVCITTGFPAAFVVVFIPVLMAACSPPTAA
jgi:hypothetical protein